MLIDTLILGARAIFFKKYENDFFGELSLLAQAHQHFRKSGFPEQKISLDFQPSSPLRINFFLHGFQ